MPENKGKYTKKYERLIRKPDTIGKQLNEAERKLSEDAHENEESLGIDEEEETGDEAYHELENEIEHEDNPDKEDE